MFNCRKNHYYFNFCAEARLAFKKPKKSPEAAPSDEDISKGTQDLLATLRGEVDQKQDKKEEKTPTYHTDTYKHTRRLRAPEPYHPESVEAAQKAVKLKGIMDPYEVKLMQSTHENLYEQYINPAFILYVKKIGKYDEVFAGLDMAMKHPYALEYHYDKDSKRLEILKKKPYDEKNKDIPDGFKIVMETSAGYITEVNGIGLKTDKGEIPWMSNEEYNKQMKNYRERFDSEFTNKGNWKKFHEVNATMQDPERTKELMKLLVEPYENISTEMKELYALENIEFPKRLIALVRARNLGFEMSDPRFIDLVAHQKLQGKTYEEITRDRYEPKNKLQVLVVADPDVTGAYRIYTRGNWADPLRVSKEGYMLSQDTDGKWKPDPRYHQALRYSYYSQHKDALDNLEKDEKEEVEKGMKDVEAQAKAREKANELRKKREKVDESIDKADITKLKEVAISVWPEYKDAIEKRKEGDEPFMRKIIKDLLDKDSSKIDAVAKEFDITFEAPIPKPPEKEEKPEEAGEKTKESILKKLDALKDAAKVKQIVDDLLPEGETAETTIEKQKEQLKKWLEEGKITLDVLAQHINQAS